jgi:hypothetical protein
MMINTKHYLVFSYHSSNLHKILEHFANNHINPQEEILLKILNNTFKAFTLCRKTNSFLPELDLQHVLVNQDRYRKKYSIPKREPRAWRVEKRETLVMHPLMFQGFLKQISQTDQRSNL